MSLMNINGPNNTKLFLLINSGGIMKEEIVWQAEIR